MILELSISKKIPLPLNTMIVSTGADLISGQKDLYLVFGEGPGYYDSGDTLPAQSETGLFDIIDPFIVKFESIVTSADSLLVSLNSLMNNDTRADLQGSVSSLNASLSSLEKTMQDDGSLTKTISNFESISENIKNNNEKIDIMLDNLSAISDTLKEAEIGLLISNLENTLKETSILFEKLNEGEGSAGQFLTNDSLYQSLNKTVTSLDSLLTDLKANPGRYVRFSLFGGKD